MNDAVTHHYRRNVTPTPRQREVLEALRMRGRCRHLPFLAGYYGSSSDDQVVREALVRYGWVEMPGGRWQITEAGIRALDDLPADTEEMRRCCKCQERKPSRDFELTAAGHGRICLACRPAATLDEILEKAAAPMRRTRSFLERRLRDVFMELDVHELGGVDKAAAELAQRFNLTIDRVSEFIDSGTLPPKGFVRRRRIEYARGRIPVAQAKAERLRQLRAEHGCSQEEAAQSAGVRLSTLQSIEAGGAGTVAEGALLKIAAAFGVEPEELYTPRRSAEGIPVGRIAMKRIDLDAINRLRRECGYSQRELASRADMAQALLNKIMQSGVATIGESTLNKLVGALGVSHQEVLQ